MEEITPHIRLVTVPVPGHACSTMSGGMAGVSSCFLPWSGEGAEPLLLLRRAEGLTEVPGSRLCTQVDICPQRSPLRCKDGPKLEQRKRCRHRDTAPDFVHPCCKIFFLLSVGIYPGASGAFTFVLPLGPSQKTLTLATPNSNPQQGSC